MILKVREWINFPRELSPLPSKGLILFGAGIATLAALCKLVQLQITTTPWNSGDPMSGPMENGGIRRDLSRFRTLCGGLNYLRYWGEDSRGEEFHLEMQPMAVPGMG